MTEHGIKLLATDFDGTIFSHGGDSGRYPALAAQIRSLRATCGTRWLVCTGRSLSNLRRATTGMTRSGVSPDFVLVRHKWLFGRRGFIWYLHLPLTLSFLALRQQHRSAVASSLAALGLKIRSELHRSRIARSPQGHLRAQLQSEEDSVQAAKFAEAMIGQNAAMHMSSFGRELDVIVLPESKGLAVKALARYLRIDKQFILSIGDARSDMYMLTEDISGMAGCPGNARPEVMGAIMRRGGHIAQASAIAGTVSVLDAYMHDSVCSEPPTHWRAENANLDMGQTPTGDDQHGGRRNAEVFLITTAFVVGFLVLCSFNIIPFGRYVFEPVRVVIRFLARVLH